MMTVVLLAALMGPVPMLILLGALRQRQELKYERAKFANLRRLASGRSWRTP